MTTAPALTEPRERPILFSSPMIRALLDGRKTMTRRVVKPQPPEWVDSVGVSMFTPDGFLSGRGTHPQHGPAEKFIKRRFARGDRLWVRETWAPMLSPDDAAPRSWRIPPGWDVCPMLAYRANWSDPAGVEWRPSIHMPRSASRITLEITSVRVERVKEITEADARAEGSPMTSGVYSHRTWFHELWREINGGESWDANPFVWVVEFRRVDGAGERSAST